MARSFCNASRMWGKISSLSYSSNGLSSYGPTKTARIPVLHAESSSRKCQSGISAGSESKASNGSGFSSLGDRVRGREVELNRRRIISHISNGSSRERMVAACGIAEFSTVSDYPPSLKSRLLRGEKLYGAFSSSFSTVVAEILGWAGYDFVVVDMEHGAGDTFAALPVLQALASTGTPAVLRIPWNDPVLVKKALDLGPAGVMFPMIQNAEEAQRAVDSCRYPPLGIRGAANSIIRASRYGLDPSYLSKCDDDLLIMCQIESLEAVYRIPEIVEVEGVDCIQMGPRDMRASIGLLKYPDDSRPLELLKSAEKAVQSCGKKVLLAGMSNPESSPVELFDRGYDLVSGIVDVALIRDAAVADLKKNKPKK
ncbi:hypothetical protein R1flu_029265 [Riccia fluitans]|uniref:HpcH/HpaI aldolase/citrate lyase domain-containing protein n=1 Tax=Riccia fluitans TaxID=41844 RepID=A0ABD1XP47_9MARC